MAERGGPCRCCCSFIFTLGLSALFMWLSLRAENPKCSIQNFYLPAINRTLKDPMNNTLFFELKLDNKNKDKGIYYDAINLTFYDNPNVTKAHLIGKHTIAGFRQGQHKKATRKANVTVNTTLVSHAASPNGSADFRVDMATAVRFRILFWKTKRHSLLLKADVRVDNGQPQLQLVKKGIRLSGAPPEHGYRSAQKGLLVALMVLAVLSSR